MDRGVKMRKKEMKKEEKKRRRPNLAFVRESAGRIYFLFCFHYLSFVPPPPPLSVFFLYIFFFFFFFFFFYFSSSSPVLPRVVSAAMY